MHIRPLASIALCATIAATVIACSHEPVPLAQDASAIATPAGDDAPPFLFDGLGAITRPIGTHDSNARRYFDQGLRLVYAFNHDAARASFAAAARFDPKCAICHWGEALVLGPNINLPMPPEAVAPAWAAIQRAIALKHHATPVERALIDALAQRYAEAPPTDRSTLDRAYADAMRDVVRRFPDDLDAATLYAESLMDLMPWAYFDKSGKPAPRTPEMLAALESVLHRQPEHTGAMHYYIHATEGSPHPEAAEPYADRLALVSPNAGHLVHMPAHTYIRVGRYHDATLNNLKATEADASFLVHCRGSNGVYPLGYIPHNWHFMAMTAGLEGASTVALRAAMQTARRADPAMLDKLTFMQQYVSAPLFQQVRFAQWDAILATNAPPATQPYPRAIWHWARGMAHVGRGNLVTARSELAAVREFAGEASLATTVFWDINAAANVVRVAEKMLAGEIALAGGHREAGVALLRDAIAAEDALNYNEPPDWPLPVRPYLGAALLADGATAEAATVYEEDLAIFPKNGWSLRGLQLALAARGDAAGAADTQRRFDSAWQHADVELTSSRL